MSRRLPEIFVGATLLPPEKLERMYRYLARHGVEVVRVNYVIEEESAVAEETPEPVWVNRQKFYESGGELDIRVQTLGKGWNALERLNVIINTPELAEDFWGGNQRDQKLPVKLEHRFDGDGVEELIVDARSLKVLAAQAKGHMMARGSVALWEYLGVTQVGPGVIDCWDKIATTMLADLTQEA